MNRRAFIPRPPRAWLASLALLGILVPHARGEERVWTSSEGKEISGELLYSDRTEVFLKIRGKVLKMPLSRLSQGDRDFLTDWRKTSWQVRAIDPEKVRPPPGQRAPDGFRFVAADVVVLPPDEPGVRPTFSSYDIWLEVEDGDQVRKIHSHTAGRVNEDTGWVEFPEGGRSIGLEFAHRESNVPTTLSVLFSIPLRAQILGIGIMQEEAVPFQ